MIDLRQPTPLKDIVADVSAKTPIGSVLRTAGWETVPQGLRDSAFFSAGVTSAQFLAAQQKAVADLIARAKGVNEKGEPYWKMDRARFIAEMRQLGEALNVERPGGRPYNMVTEGDLADPVSIARLRLVINTQLEMAYGYADWLTGMDPDILEAFPAQELVRISPRRVPRDWPTRWAEAAAAVNWEGVLKNSSRMIALKTSPIWIQLSRFKKPHPPFDFQSGMGVEEIERGEAEDLELLDADTVLIPPLKPIQAGLEASTKGLGPQQKKLLQEVFGDQVKTTDDTVKWTGKPRQVTPNLHRTARPITEAFEAKPGINPVMSQAFDRSVQSLGEVLTPIRAAKKLEVRPVAGSGHGYTFSAAGTPRFMELGQDTGTPHLEAMHEIGHYWAASNLGQGQPAAGAPVDFTLTAPDWLRAVMDTEPVQAMTAMLAAASDPEEKEILSYHLQPGELWARCFSEWGAVRSGQREGLRELSQVLSGKVSGQSTLFYWGNQELMRLLPLLDEILLK